MTEIRNRLNQFTKLQRGLLVAALVFFICLVLVSVAEVAIRVRHWVKYGGLWGIEYTYQEDIETGLRLPIAGSTFGPIKINSLGFRSPEIDVVKDAAGLRVAFLGASTTYCAESSGNETTWPHLVWKSLQEQWPDVPVDYVNAGVPGYNVATSIRNLTHRIVPLKPDVIVIYHAINDISFNSYKVARSEGLAERRTEQEFMWPAKYSLLWFLVEKNLRILKRKYNIGQNNNGTLIVDTKVLSAPFKRDLISLVEKSQRASEAVVLITFSTHLRRNQTLAVQAEAAATNLYYSPYMSIDGLLDSYEAYNDVIREVAAETGAILVGGEYSIPGNSLYFADSVHFTDRGNQEMANRVTQAMLESKAIREIFDAKRVFGVPET